MKYNKTQFTEEYTITKLPPDRPISVSFLDSQNFYKSEEWKLCKQKFYSSGNNKKCSHCGSTKNLNVDHILPIRRFWEKRLLQSNLQFLCGVCNKNKSNKVSYLDATFNRPYLTDYPYYSKV